MIWSLFGQSSGQRSKVRGAISAYCALWDPIFFYNVDAKLNKNTKVYVKVKLK